MDLLLPPGSGRVPIAAFCVEFPVVGRRAVKRTRGNSRPPPPPCRRTRRSSPCGTTSRQRRWGETPTRVRPLPDTKPMPLPARRKSGQRCAKRRSSFRARSARQWPPPPRRRACSSRSRAQSSRRHRRPTSTRCKAPAESSDNIVGYVLAINGKINGGDVYASSTLFRKMWRKLLTANVTEAIGEKREAAARNLRIIDDLRWRLASRFTSATRKVRGNAVPTRHQWSVSEGNRPVDVLASPSE